MDSTKRRTNLKKTSYQHPFESHDYHHYSHHYHDHHGDTMLSEAKLLEELAEEEDLWSCTDLGFMMTNTIIMNIILENTNFQI